MLESYDRALCGPIDNRAVSEAVPPSAVPEGQAEHGLWPARSVPWWPAMPDPGQPIQPSPGYGSATLTGERLVVTIVLLFGLRNGAVAEALSMISAVQKRSRNMLPVFLTDSSDTRA